MCKVIFHQAGLHSKKQSDDCVFVLPSRAKVAEATAAPPLTGVNRGTPTGNFVMACV